MSEPMTVFPEVWPVAADEASLWLLSPSGPLRPDLPVMADGDVHADVELELHRNGIDQADVPLLHSTSWRPEGTSIVLTYLAVVRRPGFVRENWPGACPIDPSLPDAVGRPLTHAADEPPIPRHVDVLVHSLRHAAFLLEWDATASEVLDGHWRRHLSILQPALAGLYSEVHDSRIHHRVA